MANLSELLVIVKELRSRFEQLQESL